MGWPGCMQCDNWPAVGHSGLCNVCIKNPQLVEKIANQMFDNSFISGKIDLESTCLLAFLEREPNGKLVEKTLIKLQANNKLKVREAIEEVRKEYWNNLNKKI